MFQFIVSNFSVWYLASTQVMTPLLHLQCVPWNLFQVMPTIGMQSHSYYLHLLKTEKPNQIYHRCHPPILQYYLLLDVTSNDIWWNDQSKSNYATYSEIRVTIELIRCKGQKETGLTYMINGLPATLAPDLRKDTSYPKNHSIVRLLLIETSLAVVRTSKVAQPTKKLFRDHVDVQTSDYQNRWKPVQTPA